MINYQFFYSFLLAEILTLGLLIFFILFRRFYSYFASKIKQNLQKKIHERLINLISQPEEFNPADDSPIFKHTYLLMTQLETLNRTFNGTHWQKIKEVLVVKHLLPKARRFTKSLFWIRRNFSARCFSLFPLIEDEEKILFLLKDSRFLVKGPAAKAAIKLESQRGVRILIEEMAKERGYIYFFYRDVLMEGSNQVFSEIISLSSSSELHLTCLDILSSRTITLSIPFLEQDLKSEDDNLRFFALRVILKNPPSNLETLLKKLASDSNDEIRSLALSGLVNYRDEKSIDLLSSALDSTHWNVRVQAARTLLQMKPEGPSLLDSIPESRVLAYTTAQYVREFP